MATSKGTKMPRGDKTALMKYEVPDLKYEKQEKIAEILDVIDRKIKINKQINENLAEQAQAIYTEMFIARADSKWTIGHLSDLVTVRYGKDHKKLADGNYPVYGSGGIMRYVERPLYNKESVLIPRKGTLNNVIYVNEPFWSVDTMFFTEMKQENIAKFVFHFVKSIDLVSLNAGSAVPSMTTDILNAMELKIPDSDTLAKFENLVAPIYLAMQHNVNESSNLASLRDILLPRLMSGELDVSDLDI
jgi:type I restriction enzyme S subunit